MLANDSYASRYTTQRPARTLVFGNPGVWGTAGGNQTRQGVDPHRPTGNPAVWGTAGGRRPVTVAPVKQRTVQPGNQQPFTPGGGPPPPAGAPQRPDNPYPDLKNIQYNSDPVLQDVIAGGNSRLASERARKLEEQKKLLLSFGSREMARKLLGDDPFTNTISDDPFTGLSALALNRRQELDDSRMTTENMNKSNLFFSSARGEELSAVARDRLLRDDQATNDFQSNLNMLEDTYAGAENDVFGQRRAAEQAAYDRAINDAITKWWNANNAPDPAAGGGASAGGATTGGGGSPPNPYEGATYDPSLPSAIGPSGYGTPGIPNSLDGSPFTAENPPQGPGTSYAPAVSPYQGMVYDPNVAPVIGPSGYGTPGIPNVQAPAPASAPAVSPYQGMVYNPDVAPAIGPSGYGTPGIPNYQTPVPDPYQTWLAAKMRRMQMEGYY